MFVIKRIRVRRRVVVRLGDYLPPPLMAWRAAAAAASAAQVVSRHCLVFERVCHESEVIGRVRGRIDKMRNVF